MWVVGVVLLVVFIIAADICLTQFAIYHGWYDRAEYREAIAQHQFYMEGM